MKNAFKFMKIDFSMSKSQNKVFLFLVAVAILFTVMNQNPLFVALYLAFGSVILSNSPFTLENYYNMAFVNLLPATTRSRVSGRYLFSLGYVVTGFIFSELTILFAVNVAPDEKKMLLLFPVFMGGMAMVFITIQYVLLYALGIGKNQQYIRLISMVPGFIMFGLGSGLTVEIEKMVITESLVIKAVAIVFVLGIVIMLAGKELSIFLVKRRDSI